MLSIARFSLTDKLLCMHCHNKLPAFSYRFCILFIDYALCISLTAYALPLAVYTLPVTAYA